MGPFPFVLDPVHPDLSLFVRSFVCLGLPILVSDFAEFDPSLLLKSFACSGFAASISGASCLGLFLSVLDSVSFGSSPPLRGPA